MKSLFYGDDLFFYLLKKTLSLNIEQISDLSDEVLEGSFLITDNSIFSAECINLKKIKKIYIFSDRIDTKFYKKCEGDIKKLSFHMREEYVFLDNFIDEFTEKNKLNYRDKIVLSDSFKEVVTPLEDIEYFSYNRTLKKSSATVCGKSYFLRRSLTEIENFIKNFHFIRVERGIILNIQKIKEINYKEEYVETNSGQKVYLGKNILKKISENHFEHLYRL
ncbi:hypothetical protein PM10SUCC1_05660 [Propionigenium maris DSM 9537]|uniref:HTH LytTR-type domain-containing protein n=1 Tax=Propionigenium maris DSM 9537 TaxID=1123000 RepID=A0A9W6LL84_9FUSO|nr:LytTR family transcriptional regulator DNA-binding domain-containing protein [Propionigenium maris]GLI55051.1 hypothetical protein PM10SUCC1_05660 [Propionigenium maris DSM 9537]